MTTDIHLQLFLRETGDQRLVDLTDIPNALASTPAFNAWLKTKRAMTTEDVANTLWIKTCTAGYITELHFHPNGTLDEFRLFDRFHTEGHWQLADGLLHVTIFKGENRYTHCVVANKTSNIHSAIEYKNDQLHAYLKHAQVKP
ncbi:hypothetical protein [Thaumasiovibrio subtropicus]|uniref:hypothetical protein n=1 Tax=Thaumasiovibrio subtropicus TaxID=1891207 RepID=UPI000B362589|nr:hypothetical protein [Thaumasiovibrio subtropicus]